MLSSLNNSSSNSSDLDATYVLHPSDTNDEDDDDEYTYDDDQDSEGQEEDQHVPRLASITRRHQTLHRLKQANWISGSKLLLSHELACLPNPCIPSSLSHWCASAWNSIPPVPSSHVTRSFIPTSCSSYSSLLGNDPISMIRTMRAREVAGHRFLTCPEFKLLSSTHFLPNSCGELALKFDARPYCGQFSRDGTFFYVCTQDFQVHLYDSTDPTELIPYKSFYALVGQWTITDATLNPRNDRIAYSSITPQVYMAHTDPYSMDDQICLDFSSPISTSHDGEHRRNDRSSSRFGIWSLRFSSDGRELVAGTSSSHVILYDVNYGKVVLRAKGHIDDVNAVCFADESSHILYSGSDDSLIKVWDRRCLCSGDKATPTGILPGHTDGITYISSRGDGRHLVSNSKDQSAKVFDIRRMISPHTFEEWPQHDIDLRMDWDYRWQSHPLGVYGPALCPHPRDTSLITLMGHHTVLTTLIRCHFAPRYMPYIVIGSASGSIAIYNLLGECVRQLSPVSHPTQPLVRNHRRENVVRDVAWHPDWPFLLATSWMGQGGSVSRHVYTSNTTSDMDNLE